MQCNNCKHPILQGQDTILSNGDHGFVIHADCTQAVTDSRPEQFTDAPAGFEGIAWGIEEMHKQKLLVTATTLHTFLRKRDLMYGIEYIQLYLSEH